MKKINKNLLYVLGSGFALLLLVTVLSPVNAAYKIEVNGVPIRSAAPLIDGNAPVRSGITPTKTESKTEGKKKMCPAVTPIKCEIGTSLVVLHDANNCESFVCQSKK